jgi:beta-lactam-binding protein with PASTA domain
MRLAKAKAAVTNAGFKYSLIPGTPAKTHAQDGTVQRQEPGPEQYLKKGQILKLTVHSPYVPAGVTLPDFTGKSIKESKKWLKKNKLKMSLQAGSPALTAKKSGTIEKQEPTPGTTIKKESTVTLTVHSDFVDVSLVPGVVGVSVGKAKTRIVDAGFKVKLRPGGKPSSREQAGTVERQSPDRGTKAAASSEVSIFVYGPYVETIAVPNLVGLNLADAKRKLQNTGLELQPTLLGPAPEPGKSGQVAGQRPSATTQVEAGSSVQVEVYGDYVLPGVTVPDTRGMTLRQAQNALANADLKIKPSLLGPAPDVSLSQQVNSQRPAGGTTVPPGSIVQVEVWGDYVARGTDIPDVRGMTLADAKNALLNVGLGIKPSLLGPAPNKAKALRVNSQKPLAGTSAFLGTAVQVEIWGDYKDSEPCLEPTWITTNSSKPNDAFHITTPPYPGAAFYTKDGNKYWLTGTSNFGISKPQEYIIINGDNLETFDKCGKHLGTRIRTEKKPWDFGQTAWLGYYVNDDGTKGGGWVLVWHKNSDPVTSEPNVPNVCGLTLADAKNALQDVGLGIKPSLLGPAPDKAKALRVNSQNPDAGTSASPGTAVQVEIWGDYVARNNSQKGTLIGNWKCNSSEYRVRFVQEGNKIRGYMSNIGRYRAEDGYQENEMFIEVSQNSPTNYSGKFLLRGVRSYYREWAPVWTDCQVVLYYESSAQIIYINPYNRTEHNKTRWYITRLH